MLQIAIGYGMGGKSLKRFLRILRSSMFLFCFSPINKMPQIACLSMMYGLAMKPGGNRVASKPGRRLPME
ncbi:hypothetical protein RSOL_517700 [Rhizoctonia solani AG-3 Rhs1AP]|uniref:Uncharacterized protein n=1 Tax=Rhizoctonia solani AG-3 Rhs1AP TaxID=1086054 RepID=X8JUW8_9AGAM|nr:hypothetical protein RSOL_517700 [Rhizoctonia solani AG-3 Rhs1AP]